MAAEAIHEIQSLKIRCRANDGVMVGRHFVQPGPASSRVDLRFGEAGNSIGSPRQNLLYKCRIEISFEAAGFLGVIPRQENSFAFPAEMKSGRHVDHHWEPFG